MKRITIDTRFTRLLGPQCKSAELIAGMVKSGYFVTLIISDQDGYAPTSGGKIFTWNKSHPYSYFFDLIQPTFQHSLRIVQKRKLNYFSKFLLLLSACFRKRYIVHYDYAWGGLSPLVFEDFVTRWRSESYYGKRLSERVGSFLALRYIEMKPWLAKELRFSPFNYSSSGNDFLKNDISQFKNKFEMVVLLSPTWDDDGLFEPMIERRRGVDYNLNEFEKMISFVRDLLEYYGESIGFILASKKAVDWEKILPSEQTFDLRYFEKLNITIGEAIYFSTHFSDITINWPSTYCIWATSQDNKVHCVFGGLRDVAYSNIDKILDSPNLNDLLGAVQKKK